MKPNNAGTPGRQKAPPLRCFASCHGDLRRYAHIV